MGKILIPAMKPEDWKCLLADPDKHWRDDYSAKELACCWQEANDFPNSIKKVLTGVPQFEGIEMLLGIPEHQVPLRGGSRPSQNDIWCLARSSDGLVSIAVEGKVSEPFGPMISEWGPKSSSGKEERLGSLCEILEIDNPPPGEIRYQLLHRTCSAILEAKRFFAKYAVMLVHSFSKADEGFQDFQNFVSLFCPTRAAVNEIVDVGRRDGVQLFCVWVREDR